MKPRNLSSRGNDTILPIIGDHLSEVCVAAKMQSVELAFSSYAGQAEIRVNNPILMCVDNRERMLTGSQPATFSPLLCLLGCNVEDAVASPDGRLLIVLKAGNGIRVTLKIVPVDNFPRWYPRGQFRREAWIFQYPRMRQVVGEWKSRDHLLLAGSSNMLVYLTDEKAEQ